jgi:hypothetical protein
LRGNWNHPPQTSIFDAASRPHPSKREDKALPSPNEPVAFDVVDAEKYTAAVIDPEAEGVIRMVMLNFGAVFAIAVVGALAVLVVWLVMRPNISPRRLPHSDDDRTLLERAQDAAAQLSDDDRSRLRRWLDAWEPRPPRTGAGDGITRG